ncbi:MAG: ABC transporter ATP-binding protein [Candidatus Nanopelagicales bacterium]
MSAGLAVRGLSVSLGGAPVLDGVDLDVAPHEVVALLGPSGAGKSTLLRAVAGLVLPDAGEVAWDGEDLAAVPPHLRRIGLVFQDAVLFPHLSVAANVGYGIPGLSADVRDARVRDLLALVDLDGYGGRRVETLSGGQAQRVALARALAPRPRLLLLDEPFGALDRDLRERLADDVRAVLRASDTPALHVTHDEDEAVRIGDRILRLVPGERGASLAAV